MHTAESPVTALQLWYERRAHVDKRESVQLAVEGVVNALIINDRNVHSKSDDCGVF